MPNGSRVHCASCGVCHLSYGINDFFKHRLLLNHWVSWTKLGGNVSREALLKNCSQNLILSKTFVAMVTKWNFLSNSLKNLQKIFCSESANLISSKFHLNLPWVNLYQIPSNNFDPLKKTQTEPHRSVGSFADLRTGGSWFDPWPSQYSFRGLMIVITIGFIPLSPLSIVSTMVKWESSQWLGKNFMWSTG